MIAEESKIILKNYDGLDCSATQFDACKNISCILDNLGPQFQSYIYGARRYNQIILDKQQNNETDILYEGCTIIEHLFANNTYLARPMTVVQIMQLFDSSSQLFHVN